MTKKVGITLPDAVFAQLEDIANQQNRPPTTLASFLIEFCLASQIGLAGLIDLRGSGNKDSAKVPEDKQVLSDFIYCVVTGSKPSAATLLLTAKITGIAPDLLAKAIKKNGHEENEPSSTSR